LKTPTSFKKLRRRRCEVLPPFSEHSQRDYVREMLNPTGKESTAEEGGLEIGRTEGNLILPQGKPHCSFLNIYFEMVLTMLPRLASISVLSYLSVSFK
jgi:hypothetical protein